MIRPAAVYASALALVLGGCAQKESEAGSRLEPPRALHSGIPVPGTRPLSAVALPKVLVHKSPSCGCCGSWAEHMRKAGFPIQIHNTDDLEPIKKRLGVPLGKGSCHTAEIDGLVVEGHVPAADIKRLLTARAGARGLVLPGMPAGSPGMELPDGRVQRYTVEKVNADGSTSPFASHGE